MRRFSTFAVLVASLLVQSGSVTAQGSTDEASPWEFGAGIGVGVNEPAEAFDRCGPSSTRGAVSLRGSYSVEPWLAVGVLASNHGEVGTETCLRPLPLTLSVPGTDKEYPDRIRGESGYVTTEARAVIIPRGSVGSVQPFVVAGVGRIWGKELHFPELGMGAAVPVGGLHLRFEALGRWLSVPYDVVRLGLTDEGEVVELSRTSLDEEHFPLLFRVGVGWRP